MPKFSVTMFDEGDRVSISDGDFKGASGVVSGWQHVSSSVQDVVHLITLDKPVTKDVTNEIEMPGVGKVTKKEPVTFERVEVPASLLAAR